MQTPLCFPQGAITGKYNFFSIVQDTQQSSLGRQVAEGIGWLWNHHVLRLFAVSSGLFNLTIYIVLGTLVLYVQDVLGLSVFAYGPVMAVAGASAILGAVAAGAIIRRLGRATAVKLDPFLTACSLILAAATRNPYLFGLCVAGVTFGTGIWNVVVVSYRQRVTPSYLLSRVGSVLMVLNISEASFGYTTRMGTSMSSWR